VISVGGLLVVMLSIEYFVMLFKAFGILTVMVEEMVGDVLTWLLLFLTVVFAFSLCLLGFERAGWYGGGIELEEGSGEHPIHSTDGAFWAPFWLVYGVVEPELYQAMTRSLTGWIIWVYLLIAMVILVNLLVAMFADSYSRVSADAEGHFVFLKYTRVYEYFHLRTAVPPPLNLPWCLFELISVEVLGWRQPCFPEVAEQDSTLDGSMLLPIFAKAEREADDASIGAVVARLEMKLDSVQRGHERLHRRMDRIVSLRST